MPTRACCWRRLQDEPLPFSDDVVYVFDQQLAEAGLLVVNKIDLLRAEQAVALEELLAVRYPGKRLLAQNALAPDGVAAWLEEIEGGELALADTPLALDYARYGDGEVRLAWLDQVLDVTADDGPVRPAVVMTIEAIIAAIRARTDAVAHVKFVVSAQDGEAKVSFTTLEDDAAWCLALPPLAGHTARLLLNARVELPCRGAVRRRGRRHPQGAGHHHGRQQRGFSSCPPAAPASPPPVARPLGVVLAAGIISG